VRGCAFWGNRFIIRPLLRSSLLLSLPLALAVAVVPFAGAAAPSKPSVSNWTKAKHGKVLTPAKASPAKASSAAKAPPAEKAPPPVLAGRPPAASVSTRAKSKSEGPSINGKVAVFGFTGDGAARVQQTVVSTLRTRGLQVTTTLRPVDSAEQYREMAATLQLAAYIDGAVGGAGSRGQATVHLRSGVTGRRIASVRFSADRSVLADNVGSGLWPRTGNQLTRLCAAAAKPRKGGRRALRIDAGTQIEPAVDPDSAIPAHLRNDPPTGRRKDDPWADEGT